MRLADSLLYNPQLSSGLLLNKWGFLSSRLLTCWAGRPGSGWIQSLALCLQLSIAGVHSWNWQGFELDIVDQLTAQGTSAQLVNHRTVLQQLCSHFSAIVISIFLDLFLSFLSSHLLSASNFVTYYGENRNHQLSSWFSIVIQGHPCFYYFSSLKGQQIGHLFLKCAIFNTFHLCYSILF